ncbi:MAG: hypothetical protein U0792_22340 [Gemmataceae bacterium]
MMQLARGIYDNRNFGDLPILADAFQDAGCDCDDILNHFRDTKAAHVRGCWALDLVLGREGRYPFERPICYRENRDRTARGRGLR